MDRSVPILVVEDDPIDVLNVRRAFSRCGITNPLRAAANGEEALSLLRGVESAGRLRPGIILIDLSMPVAARTNDRFIAPPRARVSAGGLSYSTDPLDP